VELEALREVAGGRAPGLDDFFWLLSQLGVVERVRMVDGPSAGSHTVSAVFQKAKDAGKAVNHLSGRSVAIGDAAKYHITLRLAKTDGSLPSGKEYGEVNDRLRALTESPEGLMRVRELERLSGWAQNSHLWGSSLANKKACHLSLSGSLCNLLSAADLWGVAAQFGEVVSISEETAGVSIAYKSGRGAAAAARCFAGKSLFGEPVQVGEPKEAAPSGEAPSGAVLVSSENQPQVQLRVTETGELSCLLRIEGLPQGLPAADVREALCTCHPSQKLDCKCVVPGLHGHAVAAFSTAEEAVLCLASVNGRQLRVGDTDFTLCGCFL